MKSIYQKEYRHLIELLITARKESGLTQEALAQKLKKPQSFVSKYENCERRIDVVEFMNIARQIGTDYSVILEQLR